MPASVTLVPERSRTRKLAKAKHRKAGVGHLRLTEAEVLKSFKLAKVHEARVAHLRPV